MEKNLQSPLSQRHVFAFSKAIKTAQSLLNYKFRRDSIEVNGIKMTHNTAVYISIENETQSPSNLLVALNTEMDPDDMLLNWYATYCLFFFSIDKTGNIPKFKFTTDPRSDWRKDKSESCYIGLETPQCNEDSENGKTSSDWGSESVDMTHVKWMVDKVLNSNEPRLGPLIELNDKLTDKWFSDLTKFEFISFYPIELRKLMKESKCTLPHMSEIYNFAFETWETLKQSKDSDYELAITRLRMFINSTYGMIGSPDTPVRFSTPIITRTIQRTRRIMKLIEDEFQSNVVYIDTDLIYFKYFSEIERRLTSFVSSKFNDHPFSIEKNLEGLFLAKKKYILMDENKKLILKGIKTIE